MNASSSPARARVHSAAVARAGLYLILVLSGVVFVYPFLWMVTASFRPEVELGQPGLWSEAFHVRSYATLFARVTMGRAFLNSVFVAACITTCVIFFGSIAGYALARLQFFGRRAILNLILFTMIIPFQMTLIPLYMLIVRFGWTDTYLALIVPGMISTLGILFFRQYFLDIPQDLVDAAHIDGCGSLRILFRIFYPLSLPVVVTVGLLTFMACWNDVLWPIIVIKDRTIMTMPQVVTLFAIGGLADELGPKLASAVLLTLPVLLAYAFFQRYFIASLATTGLKN